MRRSKQQLTEEESIEILRVCTSGVLAVHGDAGYPYAVPLSYAYDAGRLFYHFAQAGHKLDSITRDVKVSFCVIHTDDVQQATFTTHFRSVIVFGKMRLLTEDAEKRHALRCLAEKYSPNYLAQSNAEIESGWKNVNTAELLIEHMTGKAAIEIIEKKV